MYTEKDLIKESITGLLVGLSMRSEDFLQTPLSIAAFSCYSLHLIDILYNMYYRPT
jgi:hypothetical protein